jgi:hypothetical protein
VRVAATITYVWAALLFVSAVALGFPMLAGGVPFSFPALAFVGALAAAGAAFLILGRKVRAGARRAAVALIALFIASAISTFYVSFPVAPVGSLLGVIVVGSLLASWDRLE